jgi:ADP-heptose:LPS heptosyltransferase
MRSNPLDIVAAIGLAIGGAFGLAGTFVGSAALHETLSTIDGAALVVGNDCGLVRIRTNPELVDPAAPER